MTRAGIGVWDRDLESGNNFGSNHLMQILGVTKTAMPAAGNNTVSPPSFALDIHALISILETIWVR